MKKTLALSAGAIAVLSALGHFGAKPVLAQIRAAMVKNLDEPGRSPYQSKAPAGIFTSINCQANFAPIPANKRLVAEYLNTRTDLHSGTSLVVGRLTGLASSDPLISLASTKIDYPFGESVWITSQPVKLYFESGATPVIVFDLPATGPVCSTSGTLTGYLIDLNQ